MAGISLSESRRSSLLEALLKEQSGNLQGEPIQSGIELVAKLGAQALRQRRINKLLKEEKASENRNAANDLALGQAVAGGPAQSVFGDVGTQTPTTQTKEQFLRGEVTQGTPAAPQNVNAQLVHALRQNPESEFAQAVRNRQVTAAMEPPKPDVHSTKQFRVGEEYQTFPITNGQISGPMLFTGPTRQEVLNLDPEDIEGTPTQIGKHKLEFGQKVAAVNAWGQGGLDLLNFMRENPGANTVTAGLLNLGNRLMGEVRAMKSNGVFDVSDDFRGFEVGLWEDVFEASGLAGANPRVQNGFLALAIQRAAAAGLGTGKALSDRDVELQLITLGANQNDPEIIAGIFQDSFKSLSNNIRAEQGQFNYLSKFTIDDIDFGAGSASVVQDYLENRKRELAGQ